MIVQGDIPDEAEIDPPGAGGLHLARRWRPPVGLVLDLADLRRTPKTLVGN